MHFCGFGVTNEEPARVFFPSPTDPTAVTLRDGLVGGVLLAGYLDGIQKAQENALNYRGPAASGGSCAWVLGSLQVYQKKYDVTLTQPGYYAICISNKTEVKENPYSLP